MLRQATEEQLRGVLAHEIAHENLGHPTKAQVLGVGVGLGAAWLEKVFPGSGAIAPIAGTVVTGHYSRPMELDADRHAIKLLQRAGYSKHTMVNTLAWLRQLNGDTVGGIFATHPAVSERIQDCRPAVSRSVISSRRRAFYQAWPTYLDSLNDWNINNFHLALRLRYSSIRE